VRPGLEALEERQVLSTLFLTPGGNDATHFSTFQAAYQAARPGDVIQVEPGGGRQRPRSGGVGSGSGPSCPLGVWPASWNTPGSTPAASHPPVRRMM
jgi:hypothetical protein